MKKISFLLCVLVMVLFSSCTKWNEGVERVAEDPRSRAAMNGRMVEGSFSLRLHERLGLRVGVGLGLEWIPSEESEFRASK